MTRRFGQVTSAANGFLAWCCRTGGVNKVGVPLFELGRQNRQTGYALLSTFVMSSCDCWRLVLQLESLPSFSVSVSSMQINVGARWQRLTLGSALSFLSRKSAFSEGGTTRHCFRLQTRWTWDLSNPPPLLFGCHKGSLCEGHQWFQMTDSFWLTTPSPSILARRLTSTTRCQHFLIVAVWLCVRLMSDLRSNETGKHQSRSWERWHLPE